MRIQAFALVAMTVVVGCGSNLPPKELVDARAAYQSASKGPAAQQSPAELHVAKQSLDVAERSFNDIKEREAADREAQQVQASQLTDARNQLSSTKNNLEKTQEQLAREKAAREAAEKAVALALADLNRLAAVKQETRGMVITLSGGVLFASNESTLLPAAVLKLNEVADALIKGNPDSNMTIEGHTDSQGQRQYNMDLGQKRADAVKAQLVARGVAADRIKSVGVGPDRPIADNKSAEGRANNRRVEIIVEPPKT